MRNFWKKWQRNKSKLKPRKQTNQNILLLGDKYIREPDKNRKFKGQKKIALQEKKKKKDK